MIPNLWRNFISKPRLTHDIAPVTEVGYSHYGPTFAIAGTLTAQNTVILVYNICIEITNKDKKTSHFMDWFAFRPVEYIMGNFSEMDLTMTTKFTITPEKTHEYNVLFIDNGCFSEMKPLLKAIKDAWEESVIMAEKGRRSIRPETLFAEFKQLKLVVDATERLKTMSYWEPGHYNIKIRVTTKNPKQIFTAKKSFVLDQAAAQTLADNAPHIISNICQQQQTSYACSTPALTDKE